MQPDDIVRLRHMLDAAREAVGFIGGKHRENLNHDRKLKLALVKDIEIIGEAAYQTSDDARRQIKNIAWEDIIGMRRRLVHAYFDINLDVLWQTVTCDLPPLIETLKNALG